MHFIEMNYVMHSMAFICHVLHGKDLSLYVQDKILSDHEVMRSYTAS